MFNEYIETLRHCVALLDPEDDGDKMRHNHLSRIILYFQQLEKKMDTVSAANDALGLSDTTSA